MIDSERHPGGRFSTGPVMTLLNRAMDAVGRVVLWWIEVQLWGLRSK